MWGDIGNFFSSLFGGNKKKEDENNPPAPQPPQPINIQTNSPSSIPKPSDVSMLTNIGPKQPQKINIKPQNPAEMSNANKPEELKQLEAKSNQGYDWGAFGQRILDNAKQDGYGLEFLKGVGGILADTARSTANIGLTVATAPKVLNPFTSDEEIVRIGNTKDTIMGGLNSLLDRVPRSRYMPGSSTEAQQSVEDAIRRINNGTASPLDYLAAAGEGFSAAIIPGGAGLPSGVKSLRNLRNVNTTPTNIPVRQGISVDNLTPNEIPIDVRVNNTPQPLIREIGGDARTTADGVVPQQQPTTLPRTSNRMDDVRPGSQTSPETITQRELQAEINAVRNDPNLTTSQKNDIIKQLESSDGTRTPVRQQVAVKTEVEVPTVKRVETDTPSVDDSPTITQQEVAKMKQSEQAKAVGITDEQLANVPEGQREDFLAAQANVRNNPQGVNDAGFISTGKTAKGKRGNEYEKFEFERELSAGNMENAGKTLEQNITDINMLADTGDYAQASRRISSLLNDENIPIDSPLFKQLAEVDKRVGTAAGQILKAQDYSRIRKTGTADQMARASINKLLRVAQDPSKVTKVHIDRIKQADSIFVEARDAKARLSDEILGDKYANMSPKERLKFYDDEMARLDKQQRLASSMEEKVFREVLKGNTDKAAIRALRQKSQDTDVYTMDWVDTNLLSSTGTMTRNVVNTVFPYLENRVFGQIGRTVDGQSANAGLKQGFRQWRADMDIRKELGENVLRRAVTAGNTAGEPFIQSLARDMAGAEIRRALKAQGLAGDQLDLATKVAINNDLDGIVSKYQNIAYWENSLSGLGGKKTNFERNIADVFTDGLDRVFSGNADIVNPTTQFIGKAIARLAVGYPSVIGRSLAGGARRASLGAAEVVEAGIKAARGDKTGARIALQNAVKHGGSGAALYALGGIMGGAGLISGSYPDDPQERKDWESEGKTEWSVKIGDSWYSIPGYMGGFALPLMLGSGVANSRNPEEFMSDMASMLADSSPIDSLYQTLKGLNGDAGGTWWQRQGAQALRVVTPVSGFLNEISKMVDPTKNDYSRSEGVQNIVERYLGTLPGINNLVNTTDKVDQFGNTVRNPNPIELFFGAASSGNAESSADLEGRIEQRDSRFQSAIVDNGVLDNIALRSLIDEQTLSFLESGQKLTDKEMNAVYSAVTKGVSYTGDSAYRQNGDYQTDWQVLNVKKALLEADPTAKPSDIKNLETQIRRTELLAQNDIPYSDLELYQDTNVTEWRAMAQDDPELYQRLAAIDQLFADNSSSYKSGDPNKPKYTVGSGAGSGFGRGRNQFANLSRYGMNWNGWLPKVQEYDTRSLVPNSVQMPEIRRENPRIRHRITQG